MVEVEQSTKTRPASYRAKHCVVVARYCLGHDNLATDALMEAFCQIVLDELFGQVTQMVLPKDHKFAFTLGRLWITPCGGKVVGESENALSIFFSDRTSVGSALSLVIFLCFREGT